MKHKSNETSVCPVARSLDVVGEWWSLLIIRDAMQGVKRFSDFQRSLDSAGSDVAPGGVVHCGSSLPDCSATM